MTPSRLLAIAAMTAALAGCLDTGGPGSSFIADYQFGNPATSEGWAAGAVDFPAVEEADVGFIGDVRTRPEELGTTLQALYLRGTNVSDDLFMYWWRKLDGFVPNAPYSVGFDVEYISAFSQDCTTGVGPATWIKAGILNVAPVRSVDQAGWYRLNADKGQHAQGGATVVTLGDMRNNRIGCTGVYGLWARHSGEDVVTITANSAGELWLILGTESSFGVPHDIFFTRFGIRFRPAD